ncbi:glycosyltransferase family 25 protein [Candidatus Pacearchaeota archaeon]|jgi:hypothetical protein|nr:glycosyltransferase family 25 protein [Candidatus Pacearchaeota archaeon]
MMFDRCYYINLDRSTERRDRFERNVAAVDWPFPKPIRFAAIQEDAPPAHCAGRGAWSVLRSHVEIFHKCIMEGVPSVVVFEDDAVFPEDFGDRVREFMAAVPADWQQIYLSASHTSMPKVVNDKVLRCTCANLGLAYALQGGGLSKCHAFLASVPGVIAHKNLHIDTIFATLHEGEQIKAFCPWSNLVGHDVGPSERLASQGTIGVWNHVEWFNLSDKTIHQLRESLC